MSVEQFGYKQELNRALTFRDLLVYGMIFMVPIAPFGVFGYVWDGAQGMVALAYLIGMVAMFFTAMSYWSMSRAFPVSGSVYAYAQHGIHPIGQVSGITGVNVSGNHRILCGFLFAVRHLLLWLGLKDNKEVAC